MRLVVSSIGFRQFFARSNPGWPWWRLNHLQALLPRGSHEKYCSLSNSVSRLSVFSQSGGGRLIPSNVETNLAVGLMVGKLRAPWSPRDSTPELDRGLGCASGGSKKVCIWSRIAWIPKSIDAKA